MKARLRDIAEQTGLSIATVSRALHRENSPYVSEETRKRIRAVADQLGYRPNHLGRSLVTGRTGMIAFWAYDPLLPYYASLARNLAVLARAHGYRILLSGAGDDGTAIGSASPDQTLPGAFDAVIACDADYDTLVAPLGLETPLVGIGLDRPPPGCDYVGIDLYPPCQQVMAHLLGSGARRIAILTKAAWEGTDPRVMAYRTAMAGAGLPAELIRVPTHSRRTARETIAASVRTHGCPEVIFCHNDDVAIGCYRGLCDLGIRVPDDVLLVGCDGIEDAEFQACPITTIRSPGALLCQRAWEVLERRLSEPDAPAQETILPAELVLRRSSMRQVAPCSA